MEVKEVWAVPSFNCNCDVGDDSLLRHIHSETGPNVHCLAEAINHDFKHSNTFVNKCFLCSEVSDLSANDYFIFTYGKTHMRATAYILGVLAGFVAYYIHKKQ